MLPLVWLASAAKDITEIISYIAQENPAAARKLKNRLQDSVIPLAEHPYLYPLSDRIPGVREIVVHPNYLVLYRVACERIEVVAVVHARQQYPNSR
jgi:toxin ParE1/3/4